jgi:5-methylcytosine-specific restriction protein A
MLLDLFRRFAKEYIHLWGTPLKHDDISNILTKDIPRKLYDILDLNPKEYLVKGSIGQGRRVDIPWVAIMHRGVTTSPQEGYYIVILLSHDLKQIYLSLGLGWTQFSEKFGGKQARIVVREYADSLSKNLTGYEDDRKGALSLGATSDRGRGFELANIISREFDINVVDDTLFANALSDYLTSYAHIRSIYGADVLFDSDPRNDQTGSFEKNVKKIIRTYSVKIDKEKALEELSSHATSEPLKRKEYIASQILRNKAFADFVKKRAGYVCEICGRKPFLKKNNKPYAEADHKTPLGFGGPDHPFNMRCLCPLCHRIITYGSDAEKEKLRDVG